MLKALRYIAVATLSLAICGCGRGRVPEASRRQADSLYNSGRESSFANDYVAAADAMKQAYAYAREAGDGKRQTDILADLIPLMLRVDSHEECLRTALDALQLARSRGDAGKEALFDIYVGMCYQDMGESGKAREYMDEGIRVGSDIRDDDFSVRYMKGNLLAMLFNGGKYPEVIALGRSVAESLTEAEKSSAPGDAIYAQVSAMLACSYQVLVNEGKVPPALLDSARFFENAYNGTLYSQRDNGQKLRNYYIAAGKNEQARIVIQRELDQLSAADTMSLRYYRALMALAGTYSSEGEYKNAYDFQMRALGVKDSLDRLDLIEKGLEYEAEMRSARSEWELKRQKQTSDILSALFAFAVLVIFLLLVFMVMNIRKSRDIEHKNKLLARNMERNAKKDELITRLSTDDPEKTDEDLYYFRQMERITEEKKLYLDSGMTRDMLLQEYGIAKNRIPRILSKYGGVDKLNEYINAKRLHYAIKLMEEDGNRRFMDIARESGFSNTTTFYRLFMKHYGMSPSDYLKQLHTSGDADEDEA